MGGVCATTTFGAEAFGAVGALVWDMAVNEVSPKTATESKAEMRMVVPLLKTIADGILCRCRDFGQWWSCLV
jgi:hypothetical protein